MTYYDSSRGGRGRRGWGKRSGRGGGWGSRQGSSQGIGYDTPSAGAGATRRRFSLPDWLMTAMSVAVAVGVVLSWLARWINPATYGFMSTAGLLLPVLFVGNFLCLLYWVIRWRRGIYIPLVIFLTGVWGLTLFFRPQLTLNHGDLSRDRSLLSVATYNVRGMMRGTEGTTREPQSSMEDVIAVIDSLRADIVCIQEFASTPRHPTSRFEEALPAYHYKRLRLGVGSTEGGHGWGNAIYSKFPITGSGHIDFEGTNNSILWADIAVNRDTMRIFCAHLQTTAIKASDEQYIVDGGFVGDFVGGDSAGEGTRSARMKGMIGRLAQNYVIRAAQADTLAARITLSPHPVVVCGDFNDTPVSYAYSRIARGLRDSFREAGRGYGYTYRGFFNLLRIDYMLHSPDMECVEYASPSFDNSDHNPVAVKLRIGTGG
jgi:endonuclease/exonuclease/phosphatase family metal-dependent hydrolase